MPLEATIDSTTWAALALVLTIIGAALSWVAWRRRGLAAGVRGLAWTLVPIAAWLTGTLKLAVNIVDDVTHWASRLVFSPSVWLGVIVAGASAVLFVASGLMRKRVRPKSAAPAVTATSTRQPKRRDDDLDDMADIEAILKKHGI
jgi:hypothetical protein